MTESNLQTILIIDNDEGVVKAIATRLEHNGYRCITACSGAQGISEFLDQEVDLVITDLNMPAGDGITLATRIRKAWPVPIINVSGFEREYREELSHLSDVSIMKKPFEADDLLDLVEMELVLHGDRAAENRRYVKGATS